jgi:transcriptional regulator with XRE-family HTH domain
MPRDAHPLISQLAGYRRAAGLSARAAAREAGLSETVVRDWEAGQPPTVAALEQYLGVFGLRLEIAGDPVRQLAREALHARPADPEPYAPVTAAEAAENRRALADALGIVDDMPVASPVRMVRGEAA